MSLTDLFNEYVEDEEIEKVASEEEVVALEEEAETMTKLADGYVEAGRNMARREFEAMEKLAAVELSEAKDVDDLSSTSHMFAEEIYNNSEYAEYFDNKYFQV